MPIVAGALLAQRYRADSLLGRGGMGEVWRCHDLEQKRDVAIKAVRAELLSDPGVSRLFHAEVVAVARLNHRGIIPVYDLLRDPQSPALLVMAYRDGAALSSFAGPALTWPFIADVLTQVLEALAFAHARGVLHLDIKPENVLIERRGTRVRATLLDFGVARVRRPGRGVERWFERDAVIGTVEYMAPEQCAGTFERLGPWTDLFSIGAMAFELCAGRRPFPGANDPVGTIRRLGEPPPKLISEVPGVPAELASLCSVLLAIEPRNRPLHAADVLRILRAIEPDRDAITFLPPSVTTDPQAETQAAMEPTYDEKITEESHPAAASSPLPPSVLARLDIDVGDASDAEQAFTAEAASPPAGAYGLFGLRDLPVLGRLEERGAVWNAVRSAVIDRRPRLVLLEGPVGVGKSRLARDAMERAVEVGLCTAMQTSWSQTGSGDEGLRGLLENLLDTRGAPAPQVRARLDFWLDRVPGSHVAFSREVELFLRPPRDAAPDAGLPLRVAVEAIARAATLRPVLLWLDDVQWSRGEASALLAALRTRAPAISVCVIATARTEDIADQADFDALATGCEAQRVRLDPLDLSATCKLVSGLLDVDEQLCNFLATRAEGNPLFVTQLLHQLVLAEAMERRDGRYRLTRAFDLSTVPADIRAVWNRRVEQSGANVHDLAALALVRDRVSLEVAEELARLLGMPLSSRLPARMPLATTSSFETSLSRALSSGLLRIEGAAYVWAHGLLREHLVKNLQPEAARELSALAAGALTPLVDREDVQEERAMHLHRAGRAREACEALLEAGLWSFRHADAGPRRSRFETLATWARAARTPELETRALAELAYACAEIGEGPRADDIIARAQALVRDDRSASWLAVRRSQVARLQGRTSEGGRATEDALRLARASGVGEVERLALLQLGVDGCRSGNAVAARGFLQDASALCRAAGDRVGEAHALRSMTHIEENAVALSLVERSIELARAAGALRVELTCRQVWVDILWRSGARDAARRAARELTAEAGARRLRQTVSLLELQSASWAACDEDFRDARAHREAAARWGAASGATAERVALSALDVLLAVVTGDEAIALAAIDAFENGRGAYEDAIIVDLLGYALTHASPDLAVRLSKLRSPAQAPPA